MSKKETFINFIETEIFSREDIWIENYENEWQDIVSFWEDFKNDKIRKSKPMTENGNKLLSWMQNNIDQLENRFTAKEAAEALFISGRSASGIMRKLVNDGYVEKIGKDPVQYSLTEKGKTYKFDE